MLLLKVMKAKLSGRADRINYQGTSTGWRRDIMKMALACMAKEGNPWLFELRR
jgi:hypothetical protein